MLEFLCQFDFEIEHIKEKKISVDALSRKVHEMHMALLVFAIRFEVADCYHAAEDELYVRIKTSSAAKS